MSKKYDIICKSQPNKRRKTMFTKEETIILPGELGKAGSGKVGLRKQAQASNKMFRNHDEKSRWTPTKENSLGKRISKAKNDGRKNNIKKEKPELEDFVLEEPKENKKKYPTQSQIGIPSKKIVKEVNKELSAYYGLN